MYAGRVACCTLVSHTEYAPRTLLRLEKKTDRRQTVTLRLPLDAASVQTVQASTPLLSERMTLGNSPGTLLIYFDDTRNTSLLRTASWLVLLPTALARKVLQSVASVRPSVCLFVATLSFVPTDLLTWDFCCVIIIDRLGLTVNNTGHEENTKISHGL